MFGRKSPHHKNGSNDPLSIEQLRAGLQLIDRGDVNLKAFWDEHIVDFRRTLLLAIQETSDALFAAATPTSWREELEVQLEDLIDYLELSERYIARRRLTPGNLALDGASSSIN